MSEVGLEPTPTYVDCDLKAALQRLDGKLTNAKVSFQKLCEELGPFIERRDTNYHRAISLRERVAITLYTLADTVSYSTVSNLFGLGKSTVCQIVLEVCTCIVEVLFKRLVHLPVTRQDIETEVAAFFMLAGFPQVKWVQSMDVTSQFWHQMKILKIT